MSPDVSGIATSVHDDRTVNLLSGGERLYSEDQWSRASVPEILSILILYLFIFIDGHSSCTALLHNGVQITTVRPKEGKNNNESGEHVLDTFEYDEDPALHSALSQFRSVGKSLKNAEQRAQAPFMEIENSAHIKSLL